MEAERWCQWLPRSINSLTSPQAYNVKLFFQYLHIGSAETDSGKESGEVIEGSLEFLS